LRRARRRRVQSVLLGAVLLGTAVLGFINYGIAQASVGWNGFIPGWAAARAWLTEGDNPYGPETSLLAEQIAYGRPAEASAGEEGGGFLYLPPALLFYMPLVWLPLPVARAVWLTLAEVSLPILILIGLALARWRPKATVVGVLMLFSVLWYHGFRAVTQSDFSAIEALLVSGGLLAVQDRRDSVAALLLGLSTANLLMAWPLLAFVVIWAIAERRWRLVIGIPIAIAILLGVSFLVMPGWAMAWLGQLGLRAGQFDMTPPLLAIGASSTFGWVIGLLMILGFLLYLMWQWAVALRKGERRFQWTAALTIVIANLTSLHLSTSAYVVMLPALCLIFSVWFERWGQRGMLAMLAGLVLFAAGLWGLYALAGGGNLEPAWLALPVPLLAFLGLLATRWWFTRGGELGLISEEG
jgi:hypothetical protein